MKALFLDRIAQSIDCTLYGSITRFQVQCFTDFLNRNVAVLFDLGFDVPDVIFAQQFFATSLTNP
jgi:hypothetical protein